VAPLSNAVVVRLAVLCGSTLAYCFGSAAGLRAVALPVFAFRLWSELAAW
jgi:hypothetical protein